MAREDCKELNLSEGKFYHKVAKDAQRNKRMFVVPFFAFCAFVVYILIVLISCKTIPNISDVRLDDTTHAPLDAGASVYIFADTNDSRSIIEILPIDELKDPQVKMILDRTEFIAAAVFPADSGRRFQLTVWGKYPSAANAVFSSNKNWTKQKDAKNRNYWHSSENKLSLALNAKNIFASAQIDGALASPFIIDSGIEIPAGFNEFRAEKKYQRSLNLFFNEFPKAPFSCWLDSPGDTVSRILNEAGVPIRFPIQKIFFNIYEQLNEDKINQNNYIVRILFQFENTSQARGAAAVIGLASGFLSGSNTPEFIKVLFFSNQIIQENKNLEFISAPLTKEQLKQFINIFLVN